MTLPELAGASALTLLLLAITSCGDTVKPPVETTDTGPVSLPPTDVVDTVDSELPPAPAGPPTALLTINELPAEMNGSTGYYDDGEGPLEFVVRVPTHGFTLDLLLDRDAIYLDPTGVEVYCDQASGDAAAESNLAQRFEWRGEHLRWLVGSDDAMPTGQVVCRSRVHTLAREPSEWSWIRFDTEVQTPQTHPFQERDTWVVTFGRDYFTTTPVRSEDSADWPLTVEATPNGIPDFVEDMRLVGFQGDEAGDGAATVEVNGIRGVNALMMEWILSLTMAQVREIYGLDRDSGAPVDDDSVNLMIYREGEPDAPSPEAFDGTFSVHGVGGDAPPGHEDNFGLASVLDVNNQGDENDALQGYGSFTTNLVRLVLTHPAGQLLLGEFLPPSGLPIGDGPYDAQFFEPSFDPLSVPMEARGRYSELCLEVSLLTKALSALVAHEMGHALGLVPCGAPPTGLMSGIYDDTWMASENPCGHIDIPGLNVMQTGSSLLDAPDDLFGEVSFNPLAMAYLRGRLIVAE